MGASAKITGNIKALSAEIEGEIIGELTISTILTLKRRGSINGNIVTDKFIIEEGGAFNGSCSMNVASKNNMNGVKHKIGHAKATA